MKVNQKLWLVLSGIAVIVLLVLLLPFLTPMHARVGYLSGGVSKEAEQAQDKQGASPESYDSARMGQTASPGTAGYDTIANNSRSEPSIVPASYDINRMTASQPDRYLVKNATVHVEVKDARKARAEVSKFVRARKGYIAGNNEQTDYLGVRSVQVQIRVPYTFFEETMDFLEMLGDVKNRTAQSEDVTEEYVDSAARARNLKNTENRLIAHLSRTKALGDTLTVERELSRVRQEIEQIEGRLRFLAHRVSYSTIDLTLSEVPRAVALRTEKSFSAGQTASDAGRSLVAFLLEVWSIAIWAGVWAVVWLPLTAVAWMVFRKWWRRYSGSASAGTV